jgi:hypothetical protein
MPELTASQHAVVPVMTNSVPLMGTLKPSTNKNIVSKLGF